VVALRVLPVRRLSVPPCRYVCTAGRILRQCGLLYYIYIHLYSP